MPVDYEYRRNLYLAAKLAYDEAMAIDKSKIQPGTPEWERWHKLSEEMLRKIDEYAQHVQQGQLPC
jgi:hypothetical protein